MRARPGQDSRMFLGITPALKSNSGFSMALGTAC